MISIAATTGIVLDLTYTNKAVKGLLTELHVNPTRFKGKRILYIHTGTFSIPDEVGIKLILSLQVEYLDCMMKELMRSSNNMN